MLRPGGAGGGVVPSAGHRGGSGEGEDGNTGRTLGNRENFLQSLAFLGGVEKSIPLSLSLQHLLALLKSLVIMYAMRRMTRTRQMPFIRCIAVEPLCEAIR